MLCPILEEGHMTREKPRVTDPNIRAALDGPFYAYSCPAASDACILDNAARQVGALSMLYQGHYVIISSSGQPEDDFFGFVERAVTTMEVRPTNILRADSLINAVVAVAEYEGLAVFPKTPETGSRLCQFCNTAQTIRPNGTFVRHYTNLGADPCCGNYRHYSEAPSKGQTEEAHNG
jgi:hypothetical protein